MGSDPTARAGTRGPERYRFGGVVLDAPAHTLTRDDQPLPLEPKAFAVLLELLRHPGELLARDQLLDAVWGHRHITPGVLTRAIAQLRTALEDDPHHPRYIQTQHALGYRFIGALEPEETAVLTPAPVMPAEHVAADIPTTDTPASPPARRAPEAAGWGGRRRADRRGHRRRLVLGAVLAAMLAWLAWQRDADLPRSAEASVAVLPFTTLSDDREDRYFSEGLAAEMLSALAGVHGLKVAAWLPAEAIDRQQDLNALGRRLRVATVLDASVLREGDRVRISARLSDTASGYTLWSQTYDRDATAVFDTQSEIAREVAQALLGVLPDGGEDLRKRLTPTRNVAAFDAYLRGMQQLLQPGGREAAAITHFRQALSHDAGFARAQAGICRAEIWRFEGHRNADAFDNARLACLRAANMDPTMGVVQLALGDLYLARENPDKALEHYRKAESDLSVQPAALAGQARIFAAQGRQDLAIGNFRKALELAPNDADIHSALGYQQYLAGRLPDAIASLRKASELRPDDAHVWSTYGAMLMASGKNTEAMRAFERSMAIEPIEAVIGNLGTLRYQAGDYAGAAGLYRQAIELNPGNPQLWGNLGDALLADPATAALARESFREGASRAQAYVDINGSDAKALAMLAWYRANLGEPEAALGLVRRSETLDRETAEVALYNAATFALLGDVTQARRRIETARAAGMAEIRITTNAVLRSAGLVASDPGNAPAGTEPPRAGTAHAPGD